MNTKQASLFSILTDCLLILFGLGLILCTKDVSAAAAGAVSYCGRVLIPALFPFFVLSSLCVTTGLGMRLSRFLAPVMERLFHLPGAGAPALVLGLIGGYPTGAKTAIALYDEGQIDGVTCARLLRFCSCCGPAYLCSAVGMALFGSMKLGLLLLGCHIMSSLLIGMIAGRFYEKPRRKAYPAGMTQSKSSAARIFTQAVSSSFSGMLGVCGLVIFFAAALAFLESCGLIDGVVGAIPLLPEAAGQLLVRGIIEMTAGLSRLPGCGLPLGQSLAVAALLCAFGGCSVHAQVCALLEDRPIALTPYFSGKVIHGLLAACMTYAASFFFLGEAAVCAPLLAEPMIRPAHPFYFILVCGIYLALTLSATAGVLYFDEWREGRKSGCNRPAKKL